MMNEAKLKFVNMEVKTFHFNPLMVNTYIVSDETGEAVIIDPGNSRAYEDDQIREYIASKNLKIKYLKLLNKEVKYEESIYMFNFSINFLFV